MNRVIKFRGLRTDGKGWVYGYYFSFNGQEKEVAYIENGLGNAIKVIPETVGQFTGLTDKNGREIYEGDKILFQKFANWDRGDVSDRHLANVIFKEGCFMWEIVKEGRKSNFYPSHKTEPLRNTNATWGLEVIGSIHDLKETEVNNG